MNVVDSSGWLEYLADGPNRTFFQSAVEDAHALVVPSITITEVLRRMRVQGVDPFDALESTAAMRDAKVVPLDANLAIEAAFLGMELRLPLADSIILATARAYDATLWTQDADFERIDGVRYVKKVNRSR